MGTKRSPNGVIIFAACSDIKINGACNGVIIEGGITNKAAQKK